MHIVLLLYLSPLWLFIYVLTYLEMVHSEFMALQIFCAASLLKIKWAIWLHQVSTPIWQPSLSGICWQTYRIIQYSIESREVGSSNHLNNILIPYRQNSHPSGSLRKVEEKMHQRDGTNRTLSNFLGLLPTTILGYNICSSERNYIKYLKFSLSSCNCQSNESHTKGKDLEHFLKGTFITCWMELNYLLPIQW